ncbi:MAG TPA: biotin--[acetyl-CoA-carboxylase] ligase, partial [Candidatus Obscuribacterales bacterium]
MQHWRILEALDRPASALGVLPQWAALKPQLTLHLYDTLPSTNQMAWQLVQQGQGAGTVVIAAQQTAGRGQWGRTWQSDRGGLYLSLVLEPTMAIAEAPLLPLASAWGIATSFVNLGLPIQVKWPNDLVGHGRKVGGILVESRLQGKLPHAVIGVGINWDNS